MMLCNNNLVHLKTAYTSTLSCDAKRLWQFSSAMQSGSAMDLPDGGWVKGCFKE